MAERFFLWEPPDRDVCLLTAEESHHLVGVMRGRVGDEVTVFDGTGWEGPARVLRIDGGRVEVEIIERKTISREADVALDIAVAIPKGKRMGQMIRSLTEIGVRRVYPLISARSSVKPRPGAQEKWRREVVEASKQCGRNTLLEVEAAIPLGDLLPRLADYPLRLLAHADSDRALAGVIGSTSVPSPAIALVGPEGGFAPLEASAALSAGFQAVRLVPSILRIETAAFAIASALLVG